MGPSAFPRRKRRPRRSGEKPLTFSRRAPKPSPTGPACDPSSPGLPAASEVGRRRRPEKPARNKERKLRPSINAQPIFPPQAPLPPRAKPSPRPPGLPFDRLCAPTRADAPPARRFTPRTKASCRARPPPVLRGPWIPSWPNSTAPSPDWRAPPDKGKTNNPSSISGWERKSKSATAVPTAIGSIPSPAPAVRKRNSAKGGTPAEPAPSRPRAV